MLLLRPPFALSLSKRERLDTQHEETESRIRYADALRRAGLALRFDFSTVSSSMR
ncbi:MAG: hypothetical protein QOK44_5334 [Betaproteobacteria bacterium]|jgi:hypothetical protein|nr:hypothetical protein [Betaproteobacteria bacterium]